MIIKIFKVFISTIKIGWHSLFGLEEKNLFLALSIIEILKKLRIFRLIKLGEKAVFKLALYQIHNTVNLINYLSHHSCFLGKIGVLIVFMRHFKSVEVNTKTIFKNFNEKCDNLKYDFDERYVKKKIQN